MALNGFGELQKQLDDAAKAFKELDGAITTVTFDSGDLVSIEAAIRQMEDEIDMRLEPYGGNPLIEQVAGDLKEKYRQAILERAEEARRTGEQP